MYTIVLREGLIAPGAQLSAKTDRLHNAFALVEGFAMDGGIIATDWRNDESKCVMDVFDWYECCGNDPIPLARIVNDKAESSRRNESHAPSLL